MSDLANLVERLRKLDIWRRTHFSNGEWTLMDIKTTEAEAADAIERLVKERDEYQEAAEYYDAMWE